jgi:hypothetical protein
VTVTGPGSVSSTPSGIACGSTCSASFANGGSVTLGETPADGAQFTGWSGACAAAGTAPQCSVTVSAETSVGATFAATAPVTTTTVSQPPPVVCAVPRLVGVKLETAKLRLVHSHCGVGVVKAHKTRAALIGKVLSQRPAGGEFLARGGRVSLVVGSRR